jgi:diaminohydroxyphosphoribosylaminopyrimidine deaminase/5-amino-6-(5-phosphoribosylamino)uracil reductase
MTDYDYMKRAIELAELGRGWTNPNPVVGAVIVKYGRIIGEGYHKRCGELHAERNAFAALSEPAEGATLYVTLEPCCHYGKTPPCTEAILEHKIARVVIGSRDPNPLVAGKGAAILRAAGVLVEEDFMREECDRLNKVFFHYITTKTPYVVMKYAMTADGKIATKTGASQWITGEEARRHVHGLRHNYMGIMCGIGTVLADDPMLNVRIPGKKSPIRIICDSGLRIPFDSRICQSAGEYRTIVVCGSEDGDKAEQLRGLGVEIISCPGADGRVDLKELMKRLGAMGIDSIFLEGGGELNDSALRAGIVQAVKVYVAPKLFGGSTAKTPVAGCGVDLPEEAVILELEDVTKIEGDLLLEYKVTQTK